MGARVLSAVALWCVAGCSDLKLGTYGLDGATDAPTVDATMVDVPRPADVPAPVDAPLTCEHGETACAGRCVDLGTDVTNCGVCGLRCTIPPHCNGGRCRL